MFIVPLQVLGARLFIMLHAVEMHNVVKYVLNKKHTKFEYDVYGEVNELWLKLHLLLKGEVVGSAPPVVCVTYQ